MPPLKELVGFVAFRACHEKPRRDIREGSDRASVFPRVDGDEAENLRRRERAHVAALRAILTKKDYKTKKDSKTKDDDSASSDPSDDSPTPAPSS